MTTVITNQDFFKELDSTFLDYTGDADSGFLWHAEGKVIHRDWDMLVPIFIAGIVVFLLLNLFVSFLFVCDLNRIDGRLRVFNNGR